MPLTLDRATPDADLADVLPESMRRAQAAVATPEVQEIIRKLADYNLAVCMPHMHPDGGGFVELPADTVQVERSSDFLPSSKVDLDDTIAVAWRWHEGDVIVAQSCHILRRKCD